MPKTEMLSVPLPPHRTLQPEDVQADDVIRVMRDDGSTDPARDPKLEPVVLIDLYQQMLLSRAIDDRMTTLQRQGRIGFFIGATGEEAAVIGSAAVLRPNDWVLPAYREHGAVLMRGMPLEKFMANLFGNSEDPVLGRQMPCHEAWAPGRVASISSPLATQLPHAVGLAWGARLKGHDDVALAYFGDGSTSTSDFHVAMNFAAVFKSATIFLCRNNQWAISVPLARQTASETLAIKAKAYGMPGVRVDGNDLLAMVAVTREAHERAKSGAGPTLIEAITYRLKGHSTSDDPRAYRSESEVAPWLERDPIARLKKHLIFRKIWSEEQDAAAVKAIDERVRLAAAEAEKAAPPSLESMFDDVYAELPWHLKEQREEMLRASREASK